ncbi:MAG: hypothetical protein PHY08_05765 [Candidatus Cloacimonetes bacterium]|nr:hypothetical protein [Candidatus Cloacimonadota bacterium]
MNKSNFFLNQNTYLKLIWVFLSLFLIFLWRNHNLYLILFFNIIFLLPQVSILVLFFKTIIKFSFLWISYLIMGLVFSIPFYTQINFLISFLCMLLISIFCLKSFDFEGISKDFRLHSSQSNNSIIKSKFLSLVSLFILIQYFFEVFKSKMSEFKKTNLKVNKLSIGYLESIIIQVKDIIEVFYGKIPQYINRFENEVYSNVISNNKEMQLSVSYSFFSFHNLYLYYFITLYVLLVSV